MKERLVCSQSWIWWIRVQMHLMWVTVLLTFQQSGLSEQDNEYFTFTYLSMDLIHPSNCVHFMRSWTICPLHFAQVLEGRAYRLQHPWVGVVNRSQQDINKNVDMIAARRRERDYFAQSPDYGHLTSRMGSEYLGKLLSKVPLYINRLILARVELNLCIVRSSALLLNMWGQPASDSCPCQNTNCSNHEIQSYSIGGSVWFWAGFHLYYTLEDLIAVPSDWFRVKWQSLPRFPPSDTIVQHFAASVKH